MSTSCVASPTRTVTRVSTSESESTSFSRSTWTSPAIETTTVVPTTCPDEPDISFSLPVTGDQTCLSTVTSTIPASSGVTTIPVTATVDVVLTSLETQFGSSCIVIASEEPPPTTDSSSQDNAGATSLSSVDPTPTTMVSASSTTLSDGQVSVTNNTVTAVVSGSQVVVTASSPGDVQDAESSDAQLGPIIGGAVGGFVAFTALLLLIWFIRKRRTRWDDVFDKHNDDPFASGRERKGRLSLSEEFDPRPYPYGPNGGAIIEPWNPSPPLSPPMIVNDHIAEYGQYGSPSLPRQTFSRHPSDQSYNSSQGLLAASSSSPDANSVPMTTAVQVSPSLATSPPQRRNTVEDLRKPALQLVPPDQRYEDDSRSGSPVSFRERRVLQVTNAEPLDMDDTDFLATQKFLASSASGANTNGAGGGAPSAEKR